MDDAAGDVVSRLIDLSEVDLTDLATLDNSVLASALSQLRNEVENPEEAVAGFNSSL